MRTDPAELLAAADAVIFDVEGVALDTEPMWDRVQEELLARRGVRYDRETVKPLLTGRSAVEAVAVLADFYGLSDDRDELLRERQALMAERLAKDVRLMPGFRALVTALAGNKPMALATAMDQKLFEKADQAVGLARLTGGPVVTLTGRGHGPMRGKPWPDLFVEAARRLGVPRNRCVVVEDAPNGVLAARRAGARTIAVATTHPQELLVAADVVCRSLVDLVAAAIDLPTRVG